MILIVTNRQDQTADFLIVELRRRGIDYFRFNTEDFPTKVEITWGLIDGKIDGCFNFTKKNIIFSDITSIWYRRPVSSIINSQITDIENRQFVLTESKTFLDGVWKTLDCFWVSNPDVIAKAENKLFQLKTATQIGFTIWPTIVSNSPKAIESFFFTQKENIIYKPLRYGKLQRKDHVGLIFSNQITSAMNPGFSAVNVAPSLFQKYIPKKVEIRVTIVGNLVFAVEIHSQDNENTRVDWRRINSDKLFHKIHFLPPIIESLCRDLVTTLGLKFGAIDLILTPDGEYVFLEINPNGQWAWIQQLCPEILIREAMIDLLSEKSLE